MGGFYHNFLHISTTKFSNSNILAVLCLVWTAVKPPLWRKWLGRGSVRESVVGRTDPVRPFFVLTSDWRVIADDSLSLSQLPPTVPSLDSSLYLHKETSLIVFPSRVFVAQPMFFSCWNVGGKFLCFNPVLSFKLVFCLWIFYSSWNNIEMYKNWMLYKA